MKNLKRMVLTLLMAFAIILPSIVFAETKEVKTQDELAEVFKNGGEAKLTENLTLTGDINVNDGKTVTLDLNDHNILTQNNRIKVNKGYLTITGKGTINGTMNLAAPVVIYGSEDENDTNWSSLTVDENVTLEGDYGTYISWDAFGVTVNLKGTFKSVSEVPQPAFTISGNNKGIKNCPVINIYNTAKFISKDYGLYAAGYAVWNIEGATIEGVKGGFGIKAGKIIIKDAKINVTGEKVKGTYNGNGINATGAAIAIESNNGYAGNIELTIDGGEYHSAYGNSIYHYIAQKNADEVVNSKLVTSVEVKGGRFYGNIDVLEPDEIEISGGSFTDELVAKKDGVKLVTGVKAVKDGGMYTIVSENKGELVVTAPEVKVSDKVDEKVAKELTDAKLTDTVTGLKEAIDSSKIEGLENTLIEVKISSEIKSYDKEKGVLVLDIKPYYTVNQESKVLPNEAINGKVKIKVAVPNEITFTHAKVVHKNGETVIDTKEYEIKEENGQKYIEIETESFSTFEVSFYTPAKVENPNTVDGILVYTSVALMSLALLGAAALVLKKKMN